MTRDLESSLRADLGDRSLVAVARAAQKIAELELPGLCEALAAALVRVLKEPAKNDPGCRAKVALVKALLGQEMQDDELYRRVLAFKSGASSGRASKAPVSDGGGEMRGLAVLGPGGDALPWGWRDGGGPSG